METQIRCTKAELDEWYRTMSTSDLCQKLGYESPSSLYNLLKRVGIPLKGNPKLRKRLNIEIIDSE